MAKSHTATNVLFMSDYTDDAVVRHKLLNVATEFLQKSFTPEPLAWKARETLDLPSHGTPVKPQET